MSLQFNRKSTLNYCQHMISMSSKLEPAIWSCGTGQWVSDILLVESHVHLHTYTLLFFNYNLQDRACPQLAKANLGGPCLDS